MHYPSIFCAMLVATVAMTAAPRVTVISTTEAHSVSLMEPSSPEFTPSVSMMVGRQSFEALKPVLPFSVLIRNNSSRPIAVTGVLFEITYSDGRKFKQLNRVTDLTSPVSAFLHPGQVRFESLINSVKWAVTRNTVALFVKAPAYQQMLAKAAELSNATSITAKLDFIVFGDGQFVGPDLSGQFQHIQDEAEAQAAFLAGIIALKDKPDADIRAFIESKRVPSPSSASHEMFDHDFGADEQRRLAQNFLRTLDSRGRVSVLQMAQNVATRNSNAIKVHK